MKNLMQLLGRNKNMRMKENVKNVSECSPTEKQENMRLNSINSKKLTSLQLTILTD